MKPGEGVARALVGFPDRYFRRQAGVGEKCVRVIDAVGFQIFGERAVMKIMRAALLPGAHVSVGKTVKNF